MTAAASNPAIAPARKAPEWPNVLLAFGFFLILGFFCALTLFGPSARQTISTVEQRKLASPPPWPDSLAALSGFPAKAEAWVNDHLVGRENLVALYGLLKVKLLRQSSVPDVVIGKGGWLFYNTGFTLDDYRGQHRFTPAQMGFIREYLSVRRDWFARHHIAYLFVVPPDKHTIYSDYLPDRLRPKGHPGTSLDQFLAAARLNDAVGAPLPVLDLRPALMRAREKNQVYLRTDTHWNYIGARVGSAEIRRWLAGAFPQMRIPEPSGGNPTFVELPGGDLANMLGLSNVLRERRIQWPTQPPTIKSVPWTLQGLDTWKPQCTWNARVDDRADLRALFLHDSYTIFMQPTLSEACNQALFFMRTPAVNYSSLDQMQKLVAQYHPHVVVEEVLERLMDNFFFADPNRPLEMEKFRHDP